MKQCNLLQLSEADQALIAIASKAMKTAYNPYSKFHVGAALLSTQGEHVVGSNVENAAYGSSICAERSAIVSANALGKRSFEKIALIGRHEDFSATEVTAPCGSCRQMLYESCQLSGIDLTVIMSNTAGSKVIVAKMSELLPLAFGPRDLGIDLSKYGGQ